MARQRRIRVRAKHRQDVDLEKLAFALLRFAEQLTDAERQRLTDEPTQSGLTMEGSR